MQNQIEFNQLTDLQKKEWLTRINNICYANDRAFRVLNFSLIREEKFCEDNHIPFSKIEYNFKEIDPVDNKKIIEMFPDKTTI